MNKQVLFARGYAWRRLVQGKGEMKLDYTLKNGQSFTWEKLPQSFTWQPTRSSIRHNLQLTQSISEMNLHIRSFPQMECSYVGVVENYALILAQTSDSCYYLRLNSVDTSSSSPNYQPYLSILHQELLQQPTNLDHSLDQHVANTSYCICINMDDLSCAVSVAHYFRVNVVDLCVCGRLRSLQQHTDTDTQTTSTLNQVQDIRTTSASCNIAAYTAYKSALLNSPTVCLSDLYTQWGQRDPLFNQIQDTYYGVRVLQQPVLECLMSFICSANNHVKRISKMVMDLKRIGGDYKGTLFVNTSATNPTTTTTDNTTTTTTTTPVMDSEDEDDGTWYFDSDTTTTTTTVTTTTTPSTSKGKTAPEPTSAFPLFSFPTVQVLHTRIDNQEMLRDLGFGYRAAYIYETIGIIKKHGGETWLSSLSSLPPPAMTKALLSLHGVGQKVADCIKLFSLGQDDIVPVDTHVMTITFKQYAIPLARWAMTRGVHAHEHEYTRELTNLMENEATVLNVALVESRSARGDSGSDTESDNEHQHLKTSSHTPNTTKKVSTRPPNNTPAAPVTKSRKKSASASQCVIEFVDGCYINTSHPAMVALKALYPAMTISDWVQLSGLSTNNPNSEDILKIKSKLRSPELSLIKKVCTNALHPTITEFFLHLYGDKCGWAHSVLFTADLSMYSQDNPDVNTRKSAVTTSK